MARPNADTARRPAAFLNIPYDDSYEKLYLAFIAALCGFGLTPRATLEVSGSQRRLDRILDVMRACRYSFHDLSRVQLDRVAPRTPHFNMPFELGLAVAWSSIGRRRHDWTVFEAVPHRLGKSLSDLAGTDPEIHGGTARGVLRAITNVLARSRHRPTVVDLERVYRDLRQAGEALKRQLRTPSLFHPRPFRQLVIAGQLSAVKRIASLRT